MDNSDKADELEPKPYKQVGLSMENLSVAPSSKTLSTIVDINVWIQSKQLKLAKYKNIIKLFLGNYR